MELHCLNIRVGPIGKIQYFVDGKENNVAT